MTIQEFTLSGLNRWFGELANVGNAADGLGIKLPNRENAHLPRHELTDYLLSASHPVGRSKARFFRAVGFDETSVDVLAQGLPAIARDEEVEESTESLRGTKYVIEGQLNTPEHGSMSVRTIWIVEPDDPRPRFVTAYPT